MTLNYKAFRRVFVLATLACSMMSSLPARAAETIHIDGDLSDAAWKNARPLEAFKTFEGKKPQVTTTGLLLTDADNLYLAFRCEEPMIEKLEATPLPRDGELWTNDCIEIYVAPFPETEDFYQIIVDTNGQVFDAFKRDGQLNTGYDLSVTAKAQKQKDGWTLEVAIPLSEIGLSNAREALMNFGRERKPVTENTAWHGIFHQPQTWQTLPLTLDKRYDVEVHNWNFGEAQYGDNALTVEFASSAATPVEVRAQAQEKGKWETKSHVTAQNTPGQSTHVTLPYALLPQEQPQRVRYVLERHGQTIFSAATRLSLASDALVEKLSSPYYYAEEKWGFVQLESFLSEASLKSSRIRLTVKEPSGKTVSTQEVHPLQKTTRVAFKISSWRSGTGAIIAELITNEKLISSRRIEITKRSGPFSSGT